MSSTYHAFRHLFSLKGRIGVCNRSCVVLCNHSNHNVRISAIQRNSGQLDFRISQVRCMSGGKESFVSKLLQNIKQEMSKNKEMKESLKKFREETDKLEQSDAIKKARQKFESIEAETAKSSTVIKQRYEEMKEKLSETVEELEKTEFAKKGKEFTEELGKTAGKAAETISKSGQQIGQSTAFKSLSEGVKAVKTEFDETTLARAKFYKPPEKLRKRTDTSFRSKDEKTFEANEEAMGMVLHKDSRWHQSWQNFKESNQYVTKLFDLKNMYDESDHVVVRATRAFTDKFNQLFGGMFSKTEMSEVLTEICRIDPTFDKERFLHLCQREIIPNILEAMIRGDLEVLKDWCYEGPYNTISHPLKQGLDAGYSLQSRVLDISNVEVAAGKMMEQGPVLVISFNSQQIMVVRDKAGKVVEGDPDKILKIFYVWALCRDQEELDPSAAWRLLDISASTSEQWL